MEGLSLALDLATHASEPNAARDDVAAAAAQSAAAVDAIPPAPVRQISGHTLVEDEAFECPICCEHLVDPVTTECGHTFCRHCISTCFGQTVRSFTPGEAPTVPCPRCRTAIAVHYDVNPELVAIMRARGILRAQQPGAYRGTSATVNRYDCNRTESESFDVLFVRDGARPSVAGTLVADIVWAGGSVHNTYRESTCRVDGNIDENGALTAKASYSNGPWEAWSGRLVALERGEGGLETAFKLIGGEYVWHGWNGRQTKGDLELKLGLAVVEMQEG